MGRPLTPPELPTQTILAGRDDGVYGNCLQAAIAGALYLPMEAVPHFSQFLWWEPAIELWARGLNPSKVLRKKVTDEWPDPLIGQLHGNGRIIVGGKSPRGYDHVVVYLVGDARIHDPHPSRSGLVSVTDWYWFEDNPRDVTEKCFLCGRSDAALSNEGGGDDG